MKRVLIINKSFETGGIQSSMVNMANALAEHCRVDLFVYYPEGPMKERLSPKVNILPSPWRFQAIGMTMGQAIKQGNPKLLAYRVFVYIWTKLVSNRWPVQNAINHGPRLLGYDAAFSFCQEPGKHSVVSGFPRAVDGLTDAKVKVAWTHFDSSTQYMGRDYNEPFYQKMDKIFCVSRSLMEGFQKSNPTLAPKVDYCYNFLEYDKILEKSRQPQQLPYPARSFVCFSACRLSGEKAIPRATAALAPVFQAQPDLYWYIAGSGVEQGNIEEAIRQNRLEGRIVLLGNQPNPYPYMKNADLVMNVSYHEAAPMVFFEAKALGIPVFATKTASASELLRDNVDAFLCDNSEEGIRARFQEVLAHREWVCGAAAEMGKETADNRESLKKILEIL